MEECCNMFTYEDLFILSSYRTHPLHNCKDALLLDIGTCINHVLIDIINSHKKMPTQLPKMLVTAVKDNVSPTVLMNLVLTCFNVCVKVEHCQFDTIIPIGWALYYTTSNGVAICPYVFIRENYRHKLHATSLVQHLNKTTRTPIIEKFCVKSFYNTKKEKQLCEYFNNCLTTSEKTHG